MATEDKPSLDIAQTAAAGSAHGVLPDPPRRYWRRRLIVFGILLAGILVFHAFILCFLAGLLVVNDPLTSTDVVVIGGSSGANTSVPIDEVTDLYQQGLVREILLIENRTSRIVQAGIVPTLEAVVKRELAKRNVPEKTLTVIAGDYLTTWDTAHALRDWLEEHPEAHVTVLCDELNSRCEAYVLRTVLGTTTAQRVHVQALPDQRFGPSNWWHSRQGIVEVVGAFVSLTHTYVFGEPSQRTARWDPDQFEKNLREQADR